MASSRPLRFGTRGSLLALAQTRLVMAAVQAVHPEIRTELVTIETRGDRDRLTPLADVDDPGFFSDELDEALRAKRVDVCVHSVKDLPPAARRGIRRAAVPRREDPRDVVIFTPRACGKLRDGHPIRVGSSSRRRTLHAGRFLSDALPGARGSADIDFRPLRGPVDERLRRIHLPPDDPLALDGVILALAGIARLWGDAEGHAVLDPLLVGTRPMVLPLTECPTAPGQGALAVDCRRDDIATFTVMAGITDPQTAEHVAVEMNLLAGQPESAQAAFGATCISHEAFGSLAFMRGQATDAGTGIVAWNRPQPPDHPQSWDGGDWIRASRERPLPPPALADTHAVFVAHWRAVTPALRLPAAARIWASGVESWRRLARQGYWVEGCAENLGFAHIAPTLSSPVLRLPALDDWTVLTRADALQSWIGSGIGRVLPTYTLELPTETRTLDCIRARVGAATHFFWGSAAQFRALRDWLPPNAHHACGPGKTYGALRAAGIGNLQPFPSRQEWRRWVA